MIAVRIEGHTAVLGKSQGYIGLPVRHDVEFGNPTITTAWEPTPEEIEALAKGAKIEVKIMGEAHPPIMVGIGAIPE
jgi:hypothetical protein